MRFVKDLMGDFVRDLLRDFVRDLLERFCEEPTERFVTKKIKKRQCKEKATHEASAVVVNKEETNTS